MPLAAAAPADQESPDRAFERSWALTAMERAAGQLQASMQRQGREREFSLLWPLLDGSGDTASAAQALERSPGAVRVALYRLRKRYASCLRDEVRQGLGERESVDEELRWIATAVAR